jgi:ketosteroid isomerase-like protein
MIAQIRAARRVAAVAMIAATLSLAGPAASAAATTPQAQALPADLAHALEAYHQATVHNDAKTLAGLVTDDYVLVNSDSSLQDKASYLTDFAVPGFKLDPYEVEPLDYAVRGDAALTAWSFTLGWTLDGRHQTRRLRMAQFWVKQHGQWRIAYTQLTRIPE